MIFTDPIEVPDSVHDSELSLTNVPVSGSTMTKDGGE